MRALIQRSRAARVEISGVVRGEISRGEVIFLGVTHSDTPGDADVLAEKCCTLRIFEDENGKMNLSLLDVGGEVLVVSQFTLYADTAGSGRRPSYSAAARPETAIPCYEEFIAALKRKGVKVATGEFGADMQVYICNDGPVTLNLEYPRVK